MGFLIGSAVLLALLIAAGVVTGQYVLMTIAVLGVIGVNIWLNLDDVIGFFDLVKAKVGR